MVLSSLQAMKNIFTECQHGVQSHKGLNKKLTKIFKEKDSATDFYEEFVQCLALVLPLKERTPSITMIMDFIAFFVAKLKELPEAGNSEEANTESEEETPEEKFQIMIWKFVLKWHDATCPNIRFRLCELAAKILGILGDQVAFDEDLFDRLQRAMAKRLLDKVVGVRVQAVYALFRLQDPNDPECRATQAYFRSLREDPSHEVRLAIINCMYVSRRALPVFLGRTRDCKDTVRKAAFEMLAKKVHFKTLSIDQKAAVFKQGLDDRSDMVKSVFKEKLLTKWLEMCNGDILELIKNIEVVCDTTVAEKICNCLFSIKPKSDIVAAFKLLDDVRLLRHDDVYQFENAFYWRVLCEAIRRDDSEDAGELLISVLPDLPLFCSFIMTSVEENLLNASLDEVSVVERSFVCLQYLQMTELYDYVDETERKSLQLLIENLLMHPRTDRGIIAKAAQLLKHSLPDVTDRASYILELIPRLREHIQVTEDEMTPGHRKLIDLKIAKLKVNLNVARDTMENCIAEKNFVLAQETKETIASLEEELQMLEKALNPQIREVYEEKDDPDTLWKCLTLLCELLLQKDCKIDKNSLLRLVDHLVLPCVQKEDEDLRLVAIKALGMACLHCRSLVPHNFLLFLQVCQLDLENIREMALNAIFDILLLYGFDIFTTHSVREEEEEEDDDLAKKNDPGTPAHIIKMLLVLLDSEFAGVRQNVAGGFCRLLYSCRISSAKIFARLLIMWFNPVNEDQSFLKNMLGVFLPTFAAASRENAEIVLEAMMPTLRVLTKAPDTSPLSRIDTDNVLAFMMELTAPSSKDPKDNIHNRQATLFCEEICKDVDSDIALVLMKRLKNLRLAPDRYGNLKHLDDMCKEMIMELPDQVSRSKVRLFQRDVRTLMDGTVESDSDCEMADTSGQVGTSCENGNNSSNVDSKKVESPLPVPSSERIDDTSSEMEENDSDAKSQEDDDASCIDRLKVVPESSDEEDR